MQADKEDVLENCFGWNVECIKFTKHSVYARHYASHWRLKEISYQQQEMGYGGKGRVRE